jgi:hypothetical protein
MNTKVVVFAQLVDGSVMEYEADADLPKRLEQLRSEGYEGKHLVHKLLTDDWGPPPKYLEIRDRGPDGIPRNTRIPYE